MLSVIDVYALYIHHANNFIDLKFAILSTYIYYNFYAIRSA